MDYILLSTLACSLPDVKSLCISYDITCSYSKNFLRRIQQMPSHLHVDFPSIPVRWAIPKFHLLAHGPSCQSSYSLNYMHGVGCTSGEGIESNWAISNPAALSTREMSTATQHETLNDVFGAVNWAKTTKISTSQGCRLLLLAKVKF